MATLFALVDYNNEKRSRFKGAEPSVKDHIDLIEGISSDVMNSERLGRLNIDEIRLRLYDGWYDSETEDKTHVRQVVGVACERTRRRVQGIRILPECADCLLSHDHLVFWNTFRPRKPPRLCAVHPAPYCGDVGCHLPALQAWARGRCPRFPVCGVLLDDVLSAAGQKMVDGMLCADLYYVAHSREPAVVVSNDDDFIPAVLTTKSLGATAWLLCANRRNRHGYEDALKDADALEVVR